MCRCKRHSRTFCLEVRGGPLVTCKTSTANLARPGRRGELLWLIVKHSRLPFCLRVKKGGAHLCLTTIALVLRQGPNRSSSTLLGIRVLRVSMYVCEHAYVTIL
jgi:hypothetical protein